MKCGFCKNKIEAEATVCGHCQADVEWYHNTEQGLTGIAIMVGCLLAPYLKIFPDYNWMFGVTLLYLLFNIQRLFTGARVTRNGQTKDCDW